MGRAGVIQPLQMSVGEKEWSITVTASSKVRFGAPTAKVPRDRVILVCPQKRPSISLRDASTPSYKHSAIV